MPGLLFITSMQYSRFVAETSSGPSVLAPESLIPFTPVDLQDIDLPSDVLEFHLMSCCRLLSRRCFYTCSTLFSIFWKPKLDLKPLLLRVIDIFSQRANTNLMISLIELCGRTVASMDFLHP